MSNNRLVTSDGLYMPLVAALKGKAHTATKKLVKKNSLKQPSKKENPMTKTKTTYIPVELKDNKYFPIGKRGVPLSSLPNSKYLGVILLNKGKILTMVKTSMLAKEEAAAVAKEVDKAVAK